MQILRLFGFGKTNTCAVCSLSFNSPIVSFSSPPGRFSASAFGCSIARLESTIESPHEARVEADLHSFALPFIIQIDTLKSSILLGSFILFLSAPALPGKSCGKNIDRSAKSRTRLCSSIVAHHLESRDFLLSAEVSCISA